MISDIPVELITRIFEVMGIEEAWTARNVCRVVVGAMFLDFVLMVCEAFICKTFMTMLKSM